MNYRNEGGQTTADDPTRLIWYSPQCGFWTDDWDEVQVLPSEAHSDGIPCCPQCGLPGFVCTAKLWDDGAAIFQRKGNPGYLNFLEDIKGMCCGKTMTEAFTAWLVQHPNGKVNPNPRSGG